MKLELKSFGYWSVLKISFVLNLIIGFIVGLFFAVFMGFMMAVMQNLGGFSGMPEFGEELSFGALIIIYPIMFSLGAAFFNTILYLIIVFIYNMLARILGGIEMNFEEVRTDKLIDPVTNRHPYANVTASHTVPSPPPPPPIKPLPDESDLSGDDPDNKQ